MKFCRFLPHATGIGSKASASYGILESDGIHEIIGAPWDPWTAGTTRWTLKAARLLAPCEPSKIVCVGRNYAAHAAELGNEMPKEPLIFLKPPSSVVGPEDAIQLPTYSNRVEHEGELGVVIGKTCAHLRDDENPLSYILGYTCVNDVTARDLQKADVQFTRAKGFDTFCPVGPHIETHLNPADFLVECRVNGAVRQSARTSLMIFSAAFVVRWISRMMTLEPGDLIATGTPAGVGPLLAGDRAEIFVQGIGVLSNPVHPSQA